MKSLESLRTQPAVGLRTDLLGELQVAQSGKFQLRRGAVDGRDHPFRHHDRAQVTDGGQIGCLKKGARRSARVDGDPRIT